jgi:CAAX prenyl protease-like protein
MRFFSVPHTAGPAAGPVEQAALATNAHRAGHPPSADLAMPTDPTAPTVVSCILPFLALMATTILTRAFTAGFDLLYPLRVVAVAAVLWRLRGDLPWQSFRIRPTAVAIGAATFAVWMALAPVADAGTGDDPNVLGWPWSAAWLVVRVVGATVTVPIAEELFFRGFVIRRCIGPDVDAVPVGAFTWLSFLLSSVAFGVLHGDAWVAGTLAGMLFALALYTRRSLDDAVVAHATTNALLSGYVVATGSWSQWG